jgi:hypothetical protein
MVKEHYNNNTLCLLEPSIVPRIKEILNAFEPEIIIELGTYLGGFTKYLVEWFPNTQIYTIDIVDMASSIDTKFFRDNGRVIQIITNIFDNYDFLFSLLSLPKKKFFLCDNGHKKDEVKMFAGILLPGDLLGIHDFGSEVKYEEIKDTLNEFEEHEINELFSVPGASEFRFYYKKKRLGRDSIPGMYEEIRK